MMIKKKTTIIDLFPLNIFDVNVDHISGLHDDTDRVHGPGGHLLAAPDPRVPPGWGGLLLRC